MTGFLAILFFCLSAPAFAQVSPEEIRNRQLRDLETTYLSQMKEVHKAVESEKFPLPFTLSRYVGLDPQKQLGTDTRGLEFVRFNDKIVLKLSGNYNASYNADRLNQNERASRVFNEVIVPLLNQVAQVIPENVDCDGIGFEISYHVRRAAKAYDYEGKEIMVIVFDRSDAFSFPKITADNARQEILNRSDIYLDGKPYGLALGSKDPFDSEQLPSIADLSPIAPSPITVSAALVGTRLARTNPGLLASNPRNSTIVSRNSPVPSISTHDSLTVSSEGTTGAPAEEAKLPTVSIEPDATTARAAETPTAVAPSGTATPAVADMVQTKYQQQLDTFAATGKANFHFVDYAPPMFAVFQNRVVLQITLRNTRQFDAGSTSIYKRAAQAFDLFLAPQLKDILAKMPSGPEFDVVDVSVVNSLKAIGSGSSEAIEFVCPLSSLHRFTEAEITNQDLINQSAVLVNGVRIALNLQLVE
jgi:hypothetical protein